MYDIIYKHEDRHVIWIKNINVKMLPLGSNWQPTCIHIQPFLSSIKESLMCLNFIINKRVF